MKSYKEHYTEIYTRVINAGKAKGINYSTDPSSLVATVIREQATQAEAAEYEIAAAIREGNSLTARTKNSILQNTRFFGTRLQRKSGKVIGVSIFNKNLTNSISILPFTEFTSNFGATFYYFSDSGVNISIPPQGTITVNLYEGKPKTYITTVVETSPVIVLDSDPWVVDDNNILITTNANEVIKCIKDPAYVISSSPEASNLTDVRGRAEIAFGAPPTSYSPAIGTVLTIQYAETEGGSFSKQLTNSEVLTTENSDLLVTVLESSSSGSNELPIEYYEKYGHYAAKTYNNVTDANEFKAALLSKYGTTLIQDCYVYGQAAIAPLSVRYMNAISVLLIEKPGVEITDSIWADMVSYLKSISSEFWYFSRIYPEKVAVTLDINIVLNNIRFSGDVDINAMIKQSLLNLVNSAKSMDFYGERILTTYSIKETVRKTISNYTADDDPIFNIVVNNPATDISINLNRYFSLQEDDITLSISYRM